MFTKQVFKKSLLLLLLVGSMLLNQASSQCRLDLSQWEEIPGPSDDFNYINKAEMIATGKWTPKRHAGSTGCAPSWSKVFWSWDNVELINDPDGSGDKMVKLKTLKHPEGVYPDCGDGPTDNIKYYSTGQLVSTWDDYDDCYAYNQDWGFLYGIFEVRCKMSSAPEEVATVWFNTWYNDALTDCCTTDELFCINPNDTDPSDGIAQGPGTEVDLFETKILNGGSRHFWTTIQPHPNNDCDGQATWYEFPNNNIADEFHTYTMAWTPTHLSFFIDGIEVRTDVEDLNNPTRGIPHVPLAGKISMFANQFKYVGDDSDAETGEFIIDYFKVYKPVNYPYDVNNPPPGPCSASFPPVFPEYMSNYAWDNTIVNPISSPQINESVFGPIEVVSLTNQNDIRVYFSIEDKLKYGYRLSFVQGNNNSGWNYFQTPVENIDISCNIEAGGNYLYYKGVDGYLWYFSNFYSAQVPNSYGVSGDIKYNPANGRVYFRRQNNLCYVVINPNTGQFDIHSTIIDNLGSGTGTFDIYYDSNFNFDRIYYRGTDSRMWNVYAQNGNSYKTPLIPWTDSEFDVLGEVVYTRFENKTRIFCRNNQNNLNFYEYNSGWSKMKTQADNLVNSLTVGEENNLFYISDDYRVFNFELNSHLNLGEDVYLPLNLDNDHYAINYLEKSLVDTKIFYIDWNRKLRFFELGPQCGHINPPHCEDEDYTAGLCDATILHPKLIEDNVPEQRNNLSNKYSPKDDAEIQVFPNPTKGLVYAKSSKGDILSYKIFNISGMVIQSNSNIDRIDLTLDLSSFIPGLYFCLFQLEGETVVKKLYLD